MKYSRSGRRPGKEAVSEPDNEAKYIDVNDELSDDDFVDTGGKNKQASAVRRSGRNKDKVVFDSDIAKLVESTSKESTSGRRPGKEVVVERDNNENNVDVNDELSDDDFVNSSYGSGLRRSGRNKEQEVYDSDNVKTVASDSKGKGVKKQKQGNKKTQQPAISNQYAVLQTRSSPKAFFNAMLQLKPNQKACLEEIGFRGMVEFKVDGIPSKLGYVKMRMRKSEEADLNFKLNFIVLFTSIMGNIRQKGMCYVDGTKCNDNVVCRRRPPTMVWMAKLLSEREVVEMNCGGFGHGELEEDFIDEEEGNNSSTNATMPDIQEKEKDVQGEAGYPNMNRVEVLNEEVEVLDDADVGQDDDVGQDACSLFGFDRQENMCWLLTQKAFESIADEVELSIEKSKSMEVDDRPSFGVTQDFDVIDVTKNENKSLTPMSICVYKSVVEASDVFTFHGKRLTTKSNIVRSPFYSRVADADAALSSEESKYGAVTMFDQKKKDKIVKIKKQKKGAKIGNIIVAKMLHADFGRYLYGLDHIKSRNMITAELEIGEYDWQTAMVRPYAAIFIMRIMETYMGKGMRN
nr:hypothetical protein [Tanacetum cinerariifolium]